LNFQVKKDEYDIYGEMTEEEMDEEEEERLGAWTCKQSCTAKLRGHCPTSVSASLPSSNFLVKNEEDDNYGETTEEEMDDEEMDEEEEERLGAWIYKQSRTAKLLADKVLSSSLPMYPESLP
jgi:hypothetical protein